MKTLTLLLLLCAASCTLSPEQSSRLQDVLNRAATGLDRNADGQVTNRELKDSKNDPTFWISIAGGILGLLGLGAARKVQRETDQQWDMEMEKLRSKVRALKQEKAE